MKQLEEDIEKLEYDELIQKKKMGHLSEEEEERLKLLESKQKMNELSQISSEEHDEVNEENPFEDNQYGEEE